MPERPAPPPDDSPGERAERAERSERWAYRLYAGHLFTLFGLALSNAFTALTVLAAPWALARRRSAALPPASRPLVVALALYTLCLGGAIAFSVDRAHSLPQAGEVFTLATLVLGLWLVRGERQARWLVDGLVAVAGLVALVGLVQLLVGYGAIDRRIRGPFSHWMTFSGFLLICDLLLLARLAVGRSAEGRAANGVEGDARANGWNGWEDLVRRAAARFAGWRWAALVAINLALVGSLTRSAWLALAVAGTLLVLIRAPRLLAAYLPAALVFALLAPVPVVGRVVSIVDLRDASNYDRLCMFEAGAKMVAERPLFGLGPDQVEGRYGLYRAPSARRFWVPHLHNSFLQIAAERGLPALAAFVAMIAVSVAGAWRGFVREGRFAGGRADLYLGALLALVGFSVAGLFENNWGDTEVQRLALFVMALPFCLETPSRPEPPPGDGPETG